VLLEVGDLYVRFHENGEQVREAPVAVSSITDADPIVVTSVAHGLENGDEVYVSGLTEMVELNGRWLIVANKSTDTFRLNDRDGNAIDGSTWTAESTGGFVERVYEIASGYTEDDLDNLDFSQKNDVMWFVDGANPVQQLIRLGTTSWTFGEYDFEFPPALDPNTETAGIYVNATTGSTTMVAVDTSPFTSDHVGAYWVLRHFREGEELDVIAGVGSGDSVTPLNVLGNWTMETSGTWVGTVRILKRINRLKGTTYEPEDWVQIGEYASPSGHEKNFNVSGSQEVESAEYILVGETSSKAVLRNNSTLIEGVVKITGFNSATNVAVDVIQEVERSGSSNGITHDWSEGAWSDVRGYPSCVSLFEKAIWFANTPEYPQGIWKSETDLYDSFKVGSEDTSGLFIELDSKERNEILWMVPSDKMMVGTSGSEWTVSGTDLNSVISPTNIVARRQENKGSIDIRPEVVDDAIMYVQRGSSQRLRAMQFSLERDKFHGQDMQVFSDHLTESGFTSIAYQVAPDQIIWSTTGDGKLLSFTYEKDQNVYAWNPHETDGIFEGVETIYGTEDDEVWVAVKRYVNGVTRRFVERLTGYYNPSDVVGARVAFCVDTTGSMSNIIDGVLTQADEIAAFYGTVYRNVEFMLVGFKDEDDDPVFSPNTGFVSYAVFKAALNSISSSGGGDSPENGFGAIVSACSNAGWETGRYIHEVILLTDERSHSRGATVAEAYSALQSINATFYYGTDAYSDTSYSGLAGTTGGFFFSDAADFLTQINVAFGGLSKASQPNFLDSSLSFTFNTALTIRGLWHLEGQTVKIWADGYVIEDTVENGALTFDQIYSAIYVGLGYDAVLQPMQLNADGNVGSSKGYTKVVSSVYAYLIDTVGLKYADGGIASSVLRYRDVSFRDGNQEQADTPLVFTGEVELMMNTGHDRDPIIILKSSDPLPFTLAGLTVHYDVTGE